MFTLTGPSAASVLQGLGASEDQLQQPQHSHSLLKLGDSPVMLAVGDQLAGEPLRDACSCAWPARMGVCPCPSRETWQ